MVLSRCRTTHRLAKWWVGESAVSWTKSTRIKDWIKFKVRGCFPRQIWISIKIKSSINPQIILTVLRFQLVAAITTLKLWRKIHITIKRSIQNITLELLKFQEAWGKRPEIIWLMLLWRPIIIYSYIVLTFQKCPKSFYRTFREMAALFLLVKSLNQLINTSSNNKSKILKER